MGDKNLWSRLGLIVLIVGLSVWQMFPLEERLKPGIDLAGGASLMFEIDDAGLDAGDRIGLAERVSQILKERVDPQGQRNLVWRPIGQNRLEIQMPRPPIRQKELRESFESARNALQGTNITETQVRTVLALPPEERSKSIAAMSTTVKSRADLMSRLIATTDEYNKLLASTTQPEGAVAERMDKLIGERRTLTEQILATNLDPRVVTDLLELGTRNDARKAGLEKLRKAHPDLVPLIDNMTVAYDQWSTVKGALDDPSDLMRLLRGAGVLEFRILAERNKSAPNMLDARDPTAVEPVQKYVDNLAKFGPRPRPGDKYRWFKIAKNQTGKDFPRDYYVVETYAGSDYVLAFDTQDQTLTKKDAWSLKSASPGRDQMGRVNITFALASHGKFGDMTQRNIERPLCIFLDEEAISAATIRSRIDDRGEISGNFTPQYVNYVVNTLEAGALPARLKEVPLQEKTIGPSLGETNRRMGLIATGISFGLVVIFMVVYYTYNGVIADVALLLNLVITLGAMSFLQATFTLPGIAGLILTLGMAVDANVLIFERVREELQRGLSAKMAVKLGYERAFSAIFDSNLTTVLTAAILYWIGSEEIKGFGLTLGLGLCISMFTALFVTRHYYVVMVNNTLNRDETRKVWLGTAVLGALGGVAIALGWLLNRTPEARADSDLVGLGKFLLVMFLSAVAVAGSMWAFRGFYRAIGHLKQNRLPMMKLMSAPTIDWMSKYRTFWTISCVAIGIGLIALFVGLRDSKLLDIEFVGGTSVQIQVKDGVKLTDEEVREYLSGRSDKSDGANWLLTAATTLDQATVKPGDAADTFMVSVPGKLTPTQAASLLTPKTEPLTVRAGIRPVPGGVVLQTKPDTTLDVARVQAAVKASADYAREAAARLQSTTRVQLVREEVAGGESRDAFEIVTTETSRSVVTEALLAAMGDKLEVKRPIEATLVKGGKAVDGVYPIGQDANVLADVIGGTSQFTVTGPYKGGAAIVYENLTPPQTTAAIEQRLKDMSVQMEGISSRPRAVVGLTPVGAPVADPKATLYSKIAIVSADPNIPYFDNADTWKSEVAAKELELASAALSSEQSLQRVTQFAPQVASEAAQKALIAVLLSLIAIAAYLWVRFGSAEFGLAGILALYHDVAIALAAVVLSHYVWDTPIGRILGLRDFKIDLNIIAALLTIIGYSINDSIVIFDRIRENRGRMAITPKLLNDSVNQTLSRTILTVFTVMMVVLVMYIFGGEGIKGFAFVMVVGSISGSYSTFAIAVPMVQHPRVMWMTTLVIVSVTLIGTVLLMVASPVAEVILIAIILAAAAYLAVVYVVTLPSGPTPRQMAATPAA